MVTQPRIRRGTPEDSEACHGVMWASVTDFGARRGTPLGGTATEWWQSGQRLQHFLAEHASEWWLAEDEAGNVIGYARSIERDGLVELTEFFVLPANQAAGVGRALLDRAFPAGRGDVRSIIATSDVPALARYYASGVVARFPLLTLTGTPHLSDLAADLIPRRVEAESDRDITAVRDLEAQVLEYARGAAELRWLLEEREGYIYLSNGRPAGYAFIGKGGSGPIGALHPEHQPAILLHVEARAARLGVGQLEFQLPGPNEVATRHLLSRGFRIDPWINLLMSNRPFGQFDRFIGFGPPVFL
jgi:GNAT superfamily N-acetyltransferase